MLVIPVEELSANKKNEVVKFLQKYEPYCVQLNGRMKKDLRSCCAIYIDDVKSRQLYGVISFGSFIFHCLPYLNPYTEKKDQFTALQENAIESLKEFIQKEKLKMPSGISGTESGTELILQTYAKLDLIGKEHKHYDLLKLDVKNFAEIKTQTNILENEKIIRLKPDMEPELKIQLQEIQKKYELEEVQPDCFEFDEASCRLRLANALRTQFIVGILKEEKLAAKAGTSCFGYKYVSLGGVYTVPEYRKQGISTRLLMQIIRKLLISRRIPVLFVKKENYAAKKLYENLKFVKIADYEIIYF